MHKYGLALSDVAEAPEEVWLVECQSDVSYAAHYLPI
jgi:hypothetical protein